MILNDELIEVARQGDAATLIWHAKPFEHASAITFDELNSLVSEWAHTLREWERARAENYYTVLGVTREASDDAIQQAYRRLAKQYHPDTSTQDTTAMMQQLNEAYSVLSDPHLRQAYDRTL